MDKASYSRYAVHGLKMTSTLIFATFLPEGETRYRPCLNTTAQHCNRQPRDEWKISEDTWESIVLVFGILLFMICGGAVILRWICDIIMKFKSSAESDPRPYRRQRIACTTQSQLWSLTDLPPPYDLAPSYEDVVLGDMLALELPAQPPPYCVEPPLGFEPADADEFDYSVNEELYTHNSEFIEVLVTTNADEHPTVDTINLESPLLCNLRKQEILHPGSLGVNRVENATTDLVIHHVHSVLAQSCN